MNRQDLISTICVQVIERAVKRPFIIGIDGLSASGKTYLSNEIADALAIDGNSILRAGIDGFLNTKEIRNRTGEFDPDGYYRDCFDYKFLTKNFFAPIKRDGDSAEVVAQKFDLISQKSTWSTASLGEHSIVIFEGVMLFRPEINHFFDYRIHIEISSEMSLQRGLLRDASRLGGLAIAEKKYRRRYLPGQEKYLQLCQPKKLADLIVDNSDFMKPQIL